MIVLNDTTEGATVHITDLKLRVSKSNGVPLSIREAVKSKDLVDAIEMGLVRLEFTAIERYDPDAQRLLTRVNLAEAKRRGEVLLDKVIKVMTRGGTPSLDISVRPAVFAPVDM